MNDTENKITNINDDDKDYDRKSSPAAPNTTVNNIQNNYYNVNTSSIFGFVRSIFSSVVSNFIFGGLFNSAPMRGVQSFLSKRFGFNLPQPQNSFLSRLIPDPIQSLFTNRSYSQGYFNTMTLEGSDNKEVRLSNESEAVTINATTTTGANVLVGNNKDNQIFGGSGINDMWGGSSKTNDFLFGGEGKNTFRYGKGEGIDLVENTKTDDTINLYNVTLDDISNIEITADSISVVVGEDEGLAVNTNDKISPTFKLADGESYNYNRSSSEWQSA